MTRLEAVAVGAAFVAASLCSWASAPAGAKKPPPRDYSQIERFVQVMVKVRDHYVDSVPAQSLVDSAIVAMIRDSPPPPKPFSEEEVETLRSSCGKREELHESIECFIRTLDKVRDRYDGSIADAALIETALQGMLRNLDRYTKYLGVAGDSRPVREPGEPPGASFAGVLGGGIAYLRLPHISERAREELVAAMAPSGMSPPTGLVLDLRANEGGLLRETIEVVDAFAPRGANIAITRGRDPSQNRDFVASADGECVGTALVVLVDEATAAGAEIVAGAVQDLRLGVVMGRTTSGHGLIQTVVPLTKDRRGPILKLTTARVFTPSGRAYERSADGRGGVTPDLELMARPAARRVGEMDERIRRELALPQGGREAALRVVAEDEEVAAAAALLVEAGTLSRLLETASARKRADPGVPRGDH